MPIATELAELLSEVSRPGDFFVSGRAELLLPRIEVDGVGPLALPLLPAQAKALIKVASRAPHGRGTETIVDTKVRRTWQIGADKVRIGGKHWTKTLAGIVERATEGLGVSEPVTAELYKLLIYDKGSFFVSHRDTEKAPGMFATLVVALPSQSEGGELVIRHEGRETKQDLANDDPSEAAFAAFYAESCRSQRAIGRRWSSISCARQAVRRRRHQAMRRRPCRSPSCWTAGRRRRTRAPPKAPSRSTIGR